MSKTFKDAWSKLQKYSDVNKTAAVDLQEGDPITLNGQECTVTDVVSAGGNGMNVTVNAKDKNGKHVTATYPHDKQITKTTVHLTYDKAGDFVGSYVDGDKAEKSGASDAERVVAGMIRNGKKDDEIIRELKQKGFSSSDIKEALMSITNEKAMTNGEQDNPYIGGEKVTKPGESMHSADWDACVRDVQEKQGGKANAYAICTARLGETAFKSEVRHMAYVKSEIKKAEREVSKMGVGDAGPVPNSLLAGQDLEGEKDREGYTKSEDDEDLKNPEQAWASLKRMRKDLEDTINSISGKMTKTDEERNSYLEKLKDAKSKLNETSKKINKVLEYMKTH